MTIPNDVKITPELVAAHGLKPDEYQRILDLIGREPSFTELGIFSACLLYTSPSPRDLSTSRMPSSA